MAKWPSNFHEQTLEIIKFINLHVSETALIAVPAIIAALLIPIVFFILGKNDSYAFDNNVVIDKVLLYKYLLFLIVLTSFFLIFPVLFFVSVFLNILLLVLSAIVLNRSYKWLMARDGKNHALTYRQEQRVKYLRNMKSDAEILEVWDIIFSDKNLSEKNQFGFIDTLIETLKKYENKMTKTDLESANYYHIYGSYVSLLSILNQNLEKVSFNYNNNAYGDLVKYLLSYYGHYEHLEHGAKHNMLFSILKYSMQGQRYDFFRRRFFCCVQEFLDKHSNKQTFIYRFYLDLLRTLEAMGAGYADIHNLWSSHLFLQQNVITRKALESEQQKDTAHTLLRVYLEFIYDRINRESQEYDFFMGNVTKVLFPHIEPILWFRALSFYFSYVPASKNRDDLCRTIKDWCARKRNFGQVGRVYNGVFESNNFKDSHMRQHEQAEKETIYMLNLLLSKYFNIQILDKKELNAILKAIKQIREDSVFEAQSKESVNLDILESNTKLFLNET